MQSAVLVKPLEHVCIWCSKKIVSISKQPTEVTSEDVEKYVAEVRHHAFSCELSPHVVAIKLAVKLITCEGPDFIPPCGRCNNCKARDICKEMIKAGK